jgi:flagellar hook protein FlgE
MSLFGAMNTAISGLSAQSAAFSNISDNVANSQTTGFKRVDTSFEDYLTTSSPAVNDSGAVVAHPDYVNNVQGTIGQSDNPLSMAIAGQGFFAVSQATGEANNVPTFNPQQYYTRTGDFQMNNDGYLVNSAGQYLNGWLVNSTTNAVNQNALQPIQVSQTVFNPVATSDVSLSANLPATPANPALPPTSLASYNDVNNGGAATNMNLTWVQSDPVDNIWTVSMTNAAGQFMGAADLQFSTATTNASGQVPSGTLLSVTADPNNPATATPFTITTGNNAGDAVTVGLPDGNSLTIPGLTNGAAIPAADLPVAETPAGQSAPSAPITSQIDLYDALGTAQPVTLQWEQTRDVTGTIVPNDWTVSLYATGSVTPLGAAEVQFGANASGNPVPAGTIGNVKAIGTTNPVVVSGYAAGTAATITFGANFNNTGNQNITLNLGTFGGTNGVTQYAGTAYALHGLTQNGVPPGSFSSVSTQANGNIVVNYDNGQTRTIAQVPVVTFNAPNELQSQNGQAFTSTINSGTPLAEAAGTNGGGNLVTSSVEGSNVDIANEFSQLIVAQSAYSANTKVVTTANQMLQQTINMQT